MISTEQPGVDIRKLEPHQWPLAFPIVAQLRTLSESIFLKRVAAQAPSGYVLVAAFTDRIVGVMGMRPLLTLSRGRHLIIDDLVVDAAIRSLGIGQSCWHSPKQRLRRRGWRQSI